MKNNIVTTCCFGLSLALASPVLVLAQSDKPFAKKTVSTVSNKQTKKNANIKKIPTTGFATQPDDIQLLAQQFTTGSFQCELGNSLTIIASTDHAGYLMLTYKNNTAPMLPVTTSTGALRLESKSGGLVWLQLPTKSMLMNSKIGQRLADECHVAN